MAAPDQGAAEGALEKSQSRFSASVPRPQDIDDLDLRQLWWNIWRHGQRLPANRDLIVIIGGVEVRP